ncbi:MAG: DUF2938 domain-containing protein [Terricaulis sp.]
MLDHVARTILIGVGATFVLDLWSLFQKQVFSAPMPNYGLVGRWIGGFPHGRFVSSNIAIAAPIKGETVIGWSAHYAIGVMFAAIVIAIWGVGWARHPTFLPAMIVGVLGVAAPYFVMQPGMGLGVAASKAPNPTSARLRSLMAHTVFGVGLYLAALASATLLAN